MKIDLDLKVTKKQIAKWYLLGLLALLNVGGLILGLAVEADRGSEWALLTIVLIVEFAVSIIVAIVAIVEDWE